MATTWSLLLGYYVGLGLGLLWGRYMWPKAPKHEMDSEL